MSYGTNIAGASSRQRYRANAVTFAAADGDYLSRASALAGVTDSKKFTVAASLKPTSIPSGSSSFGLVSMYGSGHDAFDVIIRSDGKLHIIGYNAGSTNILDVVSSIALTAGQRAGILISADLSDPAKRGININGSVDAGAAWSVYSNDVIGYVENGNKIQIGGLEGITSSSLLDATLADFYFNAAEYVNTALSYSRFFDASGRPVDKGATGSKPTGTAPAIFLPNKAASLGTNAGTGGNFTKSGSPTDAGKI